MIATATAFTAATVRDAYARFCWPHLGQRAPLARATDMFVAGGGARNATLMRMLTDDFAALGVTREAHGSGCGHGGRGQGGGGVCAAGVADVAWVAGECAQCDRC